MLLPFFEWCESTFIGEAVRNSLWLFPAIQSIHLLGLALMGGTILLVDLRLLGLGLKSQTPAHLAREAYPWMLGAVGMTILSGIPLFCSEAVRCYYSDPFWIKMWALFLAIIFSVTIRQRVATSDEASAQPWGKLVAVVSITLWGAVAWGGRWIGFSG